MAFGLTRVLKSLLIREAGTLTPKEIEIVPAGTANTKTTLTSSQTANATITMPSATSTLATQALAETLSSKTIVVANNTITTAASGDLVATELNAALAELQADITGLIAGTGLTDHLNDATDAHDASAISSIASGNLAATNVQTALNELQTDIDTRALASGLSDHLADTVDAHDASAISSTASGQLSATDVQAAITELELEKEVRTTQSVVASNGTTTLTSSSPRILIITGSAWQDIALPDAGTMMVGQSFKILNTTSFFQYPKANSGAYFTDMQPFTHAIFTCITASGTGVGSWIQETTQKNQYISVYDIDLDGGRIFFPSTQNASSNVNCLDDYEEGTFTPLIEGLSVAGSGTYTNNYGTYVKVGKLVTFQLYIDQSAHTGSGNMRIVGMPFTAGSSEWSATIGYHSNLALTAASWPVARVLNTTSTIGLYQTVTGGGAAASIPLDTAFIIAISGSYSI